MTNPNVQRTRIALEYPVQLPDKVLTEINMRRMTVKDMLQYPIKNANDVDGEIKLIAALCELNPEDIMQLDIADYERLQATLLRFRRGKTSEPEDADQVLPAAG